MSVLGSDYFRTFLSKFQRQRISDQALRYNASCCHSARKPTIRLYQYYRRDVANINSASLIQVSGRQVSMLVLIDWVWWLHKFKWGMQNYQQALLVTPRHHNSFLQTSYSWRNFLSASWQQPSVLHPIKELYNQSWSNRRVNGGSWSDVRAAGDWLFSFPGDKAVVWQRKRIVQTHWPLWSCSCEQGETMQIVDVVTQVWTYNSF